MSATPSRGERQRVPVTFTFTSPGPLTGPHCVTQGAPRRRQGGGPLGRRGLGARCTSLHSQRGPRRLTSSTRPTRRRSVRGAAPHGGGAGTGARPASPRRTLHDGRLTTPAPRIHHTPRRPRGVGHHHCYHHRQRPNAPSPPSARCAAVRGAANPSAALGRSLGAPRGGATVSRSRGAPRAGSGGGHGGRVPAVRATRPKINTFPLPAPPRRAKQ